MIQISNGLWLMPEEDAEVIRSASQILTEAMHEQPIVTTAVDHRLEARLGYWHQKVGCAKKDYTQVLEIVYRKHTQEVTSADV